MLARRHGRRGGGRSAGRRALRAGRRRRRRRSSPQAVKAVDGTARRRRLARPTAPPRSTPRRSTKTAASWGSDSSAAATVAAVGALLEATGRDRSGVASHRSGARHAGPPRGAGRTRLGRRRGGRLLRRRHRLQPSRAATGQPFVRSPRSCRLSSSCSAPARPIATVDHLQAVERLAARDPEVHARAAAGRSPRPPTPSSRRTSGPTPRR